MWQGYAFLRGGSGVVRGEGDVIYGLVCSFPSCFSSFILFLEVNRFWTV